MDEIRLVKPTAEYAAQIDEYRAEFPSGRLRVTADPDRIPGLDGLEDFPGVPEWLAYCDSMEGRVSWYMSLRPRDGRIVGFCCLRHRLEYDDDDPEFASHIGYSIRPSEQGKGYGREQLRLVLQKAREAGIGTVRLVCRDENTGSIRTILANGGVYVDTLHGEESGLTIHRYDIVTEEAAAELRVLSPQDREAVTALFVDVFTHEPWKDDWSDRTQLDAYIGDLTGQSNSLTLGYMEGRRLVGLAMGHVKHWYSGTEYCIDELCVARDRQGRGTGTAFLQAIEAWLRDHGICQIYLQTESNVPAFHFYRHRGFRELEGHVSFAKRL